MAWAAAAGKVGAFIGTYAFTALLPRIGLGQTSGIVGFVAILGAAVTVLLLPEPRERSLEAMVENDQAPPSAVVLGAAHSRAMRPPAA